MNKPSTELQWHEPPAYRRAQYLRAEQQNPWKSAGFAAAAFAIMLGLRVVAGLNPDNRPPGWPITAAIAAVVAVIAAYGLPGLMSLLPGSIVILSPKGINNNVHTGRGWSIRFWAWDQIGYCALGAETIGPNNFDTLTVCSAEGVPMATFALNAGIAATEIERILRDNGKMLGRI